MRDDESGLMSGEFSPTCIATTQGPLDLLDPRPQYAEDLAIVVSRMRRFTGHGLEMPTSVLHHLLHVTQIMRFEMHISSPKLLLAGALHDLHEAFTGDVSRPLKLAMRRLSGGESAFDEIETLHMERVFRRFALPAMETKYPEVAQADALALGYEADILFGPGSAASWGIERAQNGLIGESSVERYLSALERLGARHVRRPV